MAKKSEGAAVRAAYDGPDVSHDALIDQIEARNREDSVRSSSAGESRQKIGKFLDDTNLNGKALSTLRSIMKTKDTAKAMDIVRSLELGLPMVKSHITGQGGTADMLELAGTDPVEPLDPDYTPDDDEGEELDDAEEEGEFDDDAEEFETAADEALGDTVVPFTGASVA